MLLDGGGGFFGFWQEEKSREIINVSVTKDDTRKWLSLFFKKRKKKAGIKEKGTNLVWSKQR